MPWKETCAVEERMAFVRDAMREDVGLAEMCRRYGISRPTGYKWLERFERNGRAGLEDLSSAPRDHPNRMAEEIEEVIVALRSRHRTWGPRKLLAYLERRE